MKRKFLRNTRPILIIILLAIIALALLYNYFRHEEKTIRKNKENELTAIANLKEEQIKQWLFERKADAALFKDSPLFVEDVKEMMSNPKDISHKDKLILRIVLTRKYYNYDNIIVTDNKGNKIISAFPMTEKLSEIELNKINEAIKSKDLYLSDFYYCELCKRIHFDLIAPLADEKGKVFATTLVRVNPDNNLFPMIQSWPIPSATSEMVLVQKKGDSAVFCNELRFKKNSALQFKIPLKNNDVMAVKAIKGETGICDGKDYRGKDVIADLRRIEGTTWFLVTKIDKEELFSEVNFRKYIAIILLVIIIALVSFIIYGIYNRYRRKIYQTLYLREKELRNMQKEFKTTLYSIGDAVLITDNAGRVTNMNPMAEMLTGWKEKEATGKPLEEVFKIINEESRNTVENPVKRVLREGMVIGLANHTLLVSKDGKEIPIADSGAPVRNEEGEITGVVLVCRDQTEERTRIRKLAESQRRFHKLFTSTNDGISLHELVFGKDGKPCDYRLLEVNEKFTDFTNIPKEKAIGALAKELYGTNEAPYLDIYSEVAITGKPLSFDTYFEPMKKHFRISVFSPEYNQFATVFQDITSQKQAEIELRKSEEKYRNLFYNAEVGMFRIKADGSEILDFSDEFLKMFGYSRNEMQGKTTSALWENSSERKEMMKILYSEGRVSNFECRMLNKKGEVRNCLTSLRLYKEQGIIEGSIIDITEKKQIELALRESEKKFRNLFNNAEVGMYRTRVDGSEMLDFNDEFLKIYGYSRDEMQGKPSVTFWADPLEREEMVRRLTLEKHVKNFECKMLNKNGEIRNCLISLRLYKEQDILEGAIIDITERKRMEQELIKAKQKAEENDKLKTAFLQNISHEVRTPMNAIIGFANLLSEEEANKKGKEYAGLIKSGCYQLLNVISDILNISLIESGQTKITEKETDLKKIINDLFEQHKKTVLSNKIKLIFKQELDNESMKVITDETKLTQILSNLIGNAIKFTQEGKVELTCKLVQRSGDSELRTPNSELLFSIEDTGIGIPEDKLNRIFDRFWQAETTTKRQYQGMGLGLSISKAYVEMLGGKIWLTSIPNKGTTFYFTIPYKPPIIIDNRQLDSNNLKSNNLKSNSKHTKTILIVEDDMFSFMLIKVLLSKYNYKLLHAMDGQEGVNMCKKNTDIGIVFMDIRLPKMDGIEATKLIKQLRPKLPVIILTAYALKTEEEIIKKCGCDDYLTKPLASAKLFEVLNKFCKN